MIKFKSAVSANQFIAAYGQIKNLFMTGRYRISAASRRSTLAESLNIWNDIAHSCQQIAA